MDGFGLGVEFYGAFQGVFGQGGVDAVAGDAAAGAAGSQSVFEHFNEWVPVDLVAVQKVIEGVGLEFVDCPEQVVDAQGAEAATGGFLAGVLFYFFQAGH